MTALKLEQARRVLWDAWPAGPVGNRPLADALGLVLAADVTSDIPLPPYPRVTMDGYAVRAADVRGATPATPVRLRIVGEAAAGVPLARVLDAREAVRAMTGAALPDGADAVVRVEDTSGFRDDWAEIHAAVDPGTAVAARGEDLDVGEVVLRAGTRLYSHHVQALASTGHAVVRVVEPPRAAVLSTGDELVPVGAVPGPGQIRESNNACVRAVLADFGVPCADLGVVRDQAGAVTDALRDALRRFELVVVSGGVSAGQKDYVRAALAACGVELRFGALHLRPGHPAAFGVHAGGVVFALPGNPVAVFATLVAVYSAGLRRRMGEITLAPPPAYAALERPMRRKGTRPWLFPVSLHAPPAPGLPLARPTEHHGSGDFVSLARSGALALLPDLLEHFEAGTVVEILRLPPRWDA
jgi:molybdopterin molybdotransferase